MSTDALLSFGAIAAFAPDPVRRCQRSAARPPRRSLTALEEKPS